MNPQRVLQGGNAHRTLQEHLEHNFEIPHGENGEPRDTCPNELLVRLTLLFRAQHGTAKQPHKQPNCRQLQDAGD
jgi:hypothetical protein